MKKTYLFLLIFLPFISTAQINKRCNENEIYSPDETLIKNVAGNKSNIPKSLPLWPKGKDSLQIYVDLNLDLSDIKLTKQTYRYNMVILVNCKGEIVSVKEISKGAQDSNEKNEIGKKIETMLLQMKGWTPAFAKKEMPVDCFVKIIFNINNEGKKVVYKYE